MAPRVILKIELVRTGPTLSTLSVSFTSGRFTVLLLYGVLLPFNKYNMIFYDDAKELNMKIGTSTKRFDIRILVFVASILSILSLGQGCGESKEIEERIPALNRKSQILLQNIRIFDVHSGTMSDVQDLLIDYNRIAEIGKADETADTSMQIDCTGKYALPGLFDCHTHVARLALAGEERIKEGLSALAFSGILQLRDVGGPIDVLSTMSKKVSNKEICGPELFFTGPMLEQSPLSWGHVNNELPGFTVPVDTLEDVDILIRELARKGACLLKTFNNVSPEIYKHLVKLARLYDLKIVHDPGNPLFNWMPMDKAIDLGVTSIEHAKAPWPVVLKDELRTRHDQLVGPDANKMMQQMFMMQVSTMGVDSISLERLHELAEKMKKNDVFLCPTLNVLTGTYEMALEQVKEKQQLEEIPDPMKAMIKKVTEGVETVSELFVKELAKAGVKFLVGQDGFEPAGTFSEMRRLRECGVSEAEILRGATLYPAQWLGVDNRLGAVEPDKQANILVVSGNPLDEIEAVAATFLVIKDGEVIFQER